MPDLNHLEIDGIPNRTLHIEGREYLFFSGTSYLGIAQNRQFREYVLEGMTRYGTNYSSSRNSNLQLRIFAKTEVYLAAYTGAEAALTLSSGYLAGQALIQTLAGTGRIIYAPGTHPAVWQKPVEAPVAQNYKNWVADLLTEALAFPEDHLIIVGNSIDPLKAQKFDFSWVQNLPKSKQITLVVDDSHGFGVTGPDGAGIYKELRNLSGVRVVVVSSLGKAMGIPAGIILGDKEIIAQVRASAFFGGASPAIPAYLYAYLQSEAIFQEARQTLFKNIQAFRSQLNNPEQFCYFDNYPVFYSPQEELTPYLFQNQVIISSFRYPTPADALINRVVLSSLHIAEDIQQLVTLINQFKL